MTLGFLCECGHHFCHLHQKVGKQELMDLVDMIHGHHRQVLSGVEGIVEQVMQLAGPLMLLKIIWEKVGRVAMIWRTSSMMVTSPLR